MGKLRERYSNWIRNWDGIQGSSGDYSISARVGKHYCPYCNNLLMVNKKTQVVNSESEDAKKFNFSGLGGNMKGNIKFTWDVFYCANCDKELPVDDILRYERELKIHGGTVDFDESQKRHSQKKGINKRLGFLIMCAIVFGAMLLIYVIAQVFLK